MNKRRRPSRFAALLRRFLVLLALGGGMPVPGAERPRLVLGIVIDQFPEPLIERLEGKLTAGGIRRLTRDGAWFTQAHVPFAATLTGAGHASIATGGLPADHGIPANDWYDRERDAEVYCVEDPAHRWIGAEQKAGEGTSPRNLEAPTFGDEWAIATRASARILAISLKDRGSILLGGHLGKAFWFDDRTGRFVSSTHYYPDGKLPDWVAAFNSRRHADEYFGTSWELLLDPTRYDTAADDRSFEIEIKGLGRTFPHVLGGGLPAPGPDFYKALIHTPLGNELIFSLAALALEAEQLGRRATTDLLLLSLTANDYCGHVFGPESLEYEDLALRTDRQLERFLDLVDRSVGLDHTLVFLTSDHGATPSPEHIDALGLGAQRIDPARIVAATEESLDAAFGQESWSGPFLNPGLFLRDEPIRRRNLDRALVERIAAEAIARIPGVALTFTWSDAAAGRIPPGSLGPAIAATFHAARSPDVFIVQRPYWYLYKEIKKYDGMHGSPHAHDSHVPVILRGPGISHLRSAQRVSPLSIGSTVCALLGLGPPSCSIAPVLPGALAADSGGQGNTADTGLLERGRLKLRTLEKLEPLVIAPGKSSQVPASIEGEGLKRLAAPRLVAAVEGGFSGLGVTRSAGDGGVLLWTVTDRGPNLVIDKRADAGGQPFGKDTKAFPFPGYQQSVLKLAPLPDGTLRILERIPLTAGGQPLNGLPSSRPELVSRERAFLLAEGEVTSTPLAPGPRGRDLEGLHVEEQPGGERLFWTCDEYGPSLQVFNGSGQLIRELLPGATPGGSGTAQDPAIAPLPRVLRHRRSNRGFEGLAGTSSHVFAMMQSPFDAAGGASGEPGHANADCRLHRLVKLDKRTLDCVQLAYEHERNPGALGALREDVKVGDIAVVDDVGDELFAIEYAARKYAHLVRLRVTAATTRLDPGRGVDYEAGRAAFVAVERTLVLDVSAELSLLPVPTKPEGLSLLGPRTILVLFDNDYGLGSDDADFFELPDIEKRAVLLEVAL